MSRLAAVLSPLTMPLLLLATLVPACSDDPDPAGAGAGGAGGIAVGGAAGAGGSIDRPAPKLPPPSSKECPTSVPASGEPCGRGDEGCSYDATDCERFDALCRNAVWTVLIRRETTCIARQCPPEAPEGGEACEESSIVGTNDCRYNAPACGQSKRAVCDGAVWTVSVADDLPQCQLVCPDKAPKVEAACTGYTPGCEYDNACKQNYLLQCNNGHWQASNGRPSCTEEKCPKTLPAAGDDCIEYAQGLQCPYETECGMSYASCGPTVWYVNGCNN